MSAAFAEAEAAGKVITDVYKVVKKENDEPANKDSMEIAPMMEGSADEGSDFDDMMSSARAVSAGSSTALGASKITSKMASLSLTARIRQKFGDTQAASSASTVSSRTTLGFNVLVDHMIPFRFHRVLRVRSVRAGIPAAMSPATLNCDILVAAYGPC